VNENIWVYSPIVLPFQDKPWAQNVNTFCLQKIVSFFKWRLGFKKTLGWTYNPLVRNILKGIDFAGIVYHSVDDLSAAPRLPKAQIEMEEQQLIKDSAIVFVTSRTLAEKYKHLAPNKLFYYPNVADYEHFSQATNPELRVPDDVAKIPGPRIGFIGAISDYKLDFGMIAECATLTPHWNWVLIGKVGEGDPLTDASILNKNNIHLIGPRPYKELPNYLKAFDVVVIPSPLNDYTRAMFPMKFFEYLAAGKVIVSTDLPSLKEFQSAFLLANTPKEMVTQIEYVLQGKVGYSPKMAALAQENTWTIRLQRMLGDLNSTLK
jgi:glycosyltransferase involved in cell wall biosynthesis